MARRPKGWHPEDIRSAIRKRCGTVAALADRSGFTRSAFSKVLVNGKYLPGPQDVIARAIGVSHYELWPNHYFPDGTPRQGRRAKQRKDIAQGEPCNAQTQEAA